MGGIHIYLVHVRARGRDHVRLLGNTPGRIEPERTEPEPGIQGRVRALLVAVLDIGEEGLRALIQTAPSLLVAMHVLEGHLLIVMAPTSVNRTLIARMS